MPFHVGMIRHNIRLSSSQKVCGVYARRQVNTTTTTRSHGGGVVALTNQSSHTSQTSRCLERLPLSSIVRSLVLGAFFTSPSLSKLGLAALAKIAQSRSILLHPDKNPVIRAVIKPLIYDHFCAGVTKAEVRHRVARYQRIGYSGIVLCYGKEFDPAKKDEAAAAESNVADLELAHWKQGNLETLDMLRDGDILAMKYTGAGRSVVDALISGAEPPKAFAEALEEIVGLATAQNCRIFVDAEHDEFQKTIDRWTIDLMRRHNRDGKVVVYNTIQAYLKKSRENVEYHLGLAHAEGWTMAIKLVRGAYINHDPRHIIHDTKDQTDDCYNGIVHDLLTGNMCDISKNDFPNVELFLAGHNEESVARASSLVRELASKGMLRTMPRFGQLQGMSDPLGCRILEESEEMKATCSNRNFAPPKVYKVAPWGSVQDCMMYLVRRAVENRGATHRMKDGMAEMTKELRRRAFGKIMGR
ncbi:FAD-linked oxidoreductase [Pleomassaria siparia CBS 279.74]|uniref:Proline dehydrogenase n=1 Tax=Pleomassaria siparia CBS 279.74 TaxID=1314801 RepID=A0A6G1K0D5_9PLEO|nr:FAD-linked oxidoreductase [Pleomassaria siparia CBS 279.74]